MDGRYYHHYASSDRMRYMPEHPGPYPAPAMPANLDALGISPPEPEPPLSPGLEKVGLIRTINTVYERESRSVDDRDSEWGVPGTHDNACHYH